MILQTVIKKEKNNETWRIRRQIDQTVGRGDGGSGGSGGGRSQRFADDGESMSLADAEDSGQHGATPDGADDVDGDDDDGTFFGILETNVTASVGDTAFLRCRLKKTQAKHQVSGFLRCTLTTDRLIYSGEFGLKKAIEGSK